MEHFSRNLLFLRKLKNKSQEVLAAELGLDRTAITNYERGNSVPNLKKLDEIVKLFDIPMQVLLYDDVSKFYDEKGNLNSNPFSNLFVKYEGIIHPGSAPIYPVLVSDAGSDYGKKPNINQEGRGIPVYNAIATAGSAELFFDEPEEIIGYIDIPAYNDCIGWVRVSGDSMYKKYRAGDFVAVKPHPDLNVIPFGHVFWVLTKDNQKLLKYVRKGKTKKEVILRSENPDYDDIDLPISKIHKIFRVRATLRDED